MKDWNRRVLICAISFLLAAVCVLAFRDCGELRWWIVSLCIVAILLTGIVWRSLVRPMDAIENGYDMVLSQDMNSRLRKVGEKHADRIVEVFNALASRLKEERLRLREQESFLNQLIRVSPLGVAVMDFDGNISMINPAFREMSGLEKEPDDYIGVPLKDIGGELTEAALAVPAGSSGVIRMGDTRIYRMSNLWFMERGFRRPFILVESLTEEVMKAERSAYGKVIRIMSHEVNNTVGGIQSLLETLEGIVEEKDLLEALESGENRCRSLSEFIGGYTDVVKLADPVLMRLDLNGEITKAVPFLNMLTGEGTELRVNNAEEPLMVDIDPVMFGQVLVNIVKNAAESIRQRMSCGTPGDKGVIEIAAGKDADGHVVMEVTDNGSGIDGETRSKLFTPFYTTKSTGRGIGLTLTSEILSHHHCRYSLQTGPDALTRFRIRF